MGGGTRFYAPRRSSLRCGEKIESAAERFLSVFSGKLKTLQGQNEVVSYFIKVTTALITERTNKSTTEHLMDLFKSRPPSSFY